MPIPEQPAPEGTGIASEAPKSERRRCACGATTTLLVSPTKRRSTALTVCANCQEGLPAPITA